MSGVTLDAGALIAFDRGERAMLVLVKRALETDRSIAIPAGALAQAWRDGRKQVALARLVSNEQVEIVPLDALTSREAGQLCGVTRTRDVVDASVVLCARKRGHAVVTSDAADLRRLDPKLRLVEV